MRVSSRWLAWALCLLSASSSYAQSDSSADSSTAVFRRLIAERTRARSEADTAGYRRLADPALVFLEDDGTRQTLDQHIHLIAKAGRETTRIRRDIDSLHVHFEGGLALVDHWGVLRERYGSQDVESPYRLLDVFVHRGDQWLLLRHAETHAVASLRAIALAPAALDDYVGRYEWWPGYIETFTRRGNQLFYQGTGDTAATPVRAATREAFFTAGDPGLTVFVRDRAGRVTGYLLTWPDGQVTAARKLR